MEKNQNPNTWSDLPLDLLNLVFKRLSFANFRRAKSVCSSWYSETMRAQKSDPVADALPQRQKQQQTQFMHIFQS